MAGNGLDSGNGFVFGGADGGSVGSAGGAVGGAGALVDCPTAGFWSGCFISRLRKYTARSACLVEKFLPVATETYCSPVAR